MPSKRHHGCTDSNRPAASSTKRHRGARDGPMAPAPGKPLPADLLLEIAARTDVVTLVRCAAVCRPLRRDILDPAFRRRRRRLAAARALLLGVSYQLQHKNTGVDSAYVVETRPSPRPRVRIDHGLLESSVPMASRDGLLVLQRRRRLERIHDELFVCDTMTGVATSLPPIGLGFCCLLTALLTVGADRSFELLVADYCVLRIQTFTSKNGVWSAVRATVPDDPPKFHQMPGAAGASGVALGRTVHWLEVNRFITPKHIVALDVDAATATTVQLPPGYCDRTDYMYGRNVLLAAVGGRLSLLVAESQAISMWSLTTPTPPPPAAWTRQVVIGTQEIERQTGLFSTFRWPMVRFYGFGERTGTVVLQIQDSVLVQLNLGTKEATTLCRDWSKRKLFTRVNLLEIDLSSLLQTMKSF
ncbi:hypothetical protein ACP70R_025553 [Stipagrostis hirtigluma subsp. patula]